MLEMMNKTWKAVIAAAFVLALVAGNSAQAVPLAPGGGPLPIVGEPTNNFPPGGAFPFNGTGVLIDQFASSYSLAGGFSGFLNTYVINEGVANPLGGYTFFYEVDNDINGNPAILQEINFVQFSGFSTSPIVDADFSTTPLLSGGFAFPTDVDSTIDGNTVAFFYNNPTDPIAPGDVSAWMFIRTSTTTVNFNTADLIGAGQASAGILAPVPEPTTVLFGLALVGVMGLGRRRRS